MDSSNKLVLDSVRFKMQIDVATSILNYPTHSYINVYPRVGKSLIAFIVGSKNNKTTYIVVPNEQLKQDMQTELDKVYSYLDKDFKFNSRIELYTKSDLLKLNMLCQPDTQYDIIIDEIHKYSTGEAMSAIVNYMRLANVRIIGMTGSPNEVPIILGLKMVHFIGEQEAIDNNFVSDGIEYGIALTFNETEKVDYITYSNIIREQLNLLRNAYKLLSFKNELDCLYACAKGRVIKGVYLKGGIITDRISTAMGWHNQLDLTNDYNKNLDLNFNPNNLFENCKKAAAFIDKRNDLINNNILKVNKVIEILSTLEGATIIFTGTKKLAELIYSNLNRLDVGIYYSSMPSRYCYGLDGELIKDKAGELKMIGTARQKTLLLDKLNVE